MARARITPGFDHRVQVVYRDGRYYIGDRVVTDDWVRYRLNRDEIDVREEKTDG